MIWSIELPRKSDAPTEITDWFIVKLFLEKPAYILGGLTYGQEGRISSTIVSTTKSTVITSSGRRYKLIGKPSEPKANAAYVLGAKLKPNGELLCEYEIQLNTSLN